MRSSAESGESRGIFTPVVPAPSPEEWERMAPEAERLAEAVAERLAASSAGQDELRTIVLVGLLGALERYQPRSSRSFADFAAPLLMDHILRYRSKRLYEFLGQPGKSLKSKRDVSGKSGRPWVSN